MSGSNWITTRPCFRSRWSVFSGSSVGFVSLMVEPPCKNLLHVRGDAHMHDAIRVRDRPAAGGAALDLVDVLHPTCNLAPDRIVSIQRWRRRKHDKKLAVAGVG